MCIKHVKKCLLIINSLWNNLVEFGGSKVDILMISETNIEEIFSLSQFKIGSFNSYFDLARTVVEGLLSYLSGNIYQQSS